MPLLVGGLPCGGSHRREVEPLGFPLAVEVEAETVTHCSPTPHSRELHSRKVQRAHVEDEHIHSPLLVEWFLFFKASQPQSLWRSVLFSC